jgi:hypothetical protein
LWDVIWKLKCPAEVKIFLWRFVKETIPCRVVLANRHVPVSGQCPLCEVGAEDIKHVLFQCNRAKTIWCQLGLAELIEKACIVDHAGQVGLEYLLCEDNQFPTILGQSKIPDLVDITYWYLWWERRQITHGESVKEPARSALAIGALYSNFTLANSALPRMKKIGWVKPFMLMISAVLLAE